MSKKKLTNKNPIPQLKEEPPLVGGALAGRVKPEPITIYSLKLFNAVEVGSTTITFVRDQSLEDPHRHQYKMSMETLDAHWIRIEHIAKKDVVYVSVFNTISIKLACDG